MQSIGPLVEYAVFAVLLVLSIMAVAITFERLRFYRAIRPTGYTSRSRLETDLTRRLNIIGTIGANAPYIGLLGTVLDRCWSTMPQKMPSPRRWGWSCSVPRRWMATPAS